MIYDLDGEFMDKEKRKQLFWEFFRYLLVGGLAFVIDSGVLALFKEFVFSGGTPLELFICTALGFIAGLIANYVLSLLFVFKKSENKSSGKGVGAFVIFALIGVIGLGLTELGMYIGVYVFKWHYIVTKILVAGAVLVWNYVGRKIFVFGRVGKKDKE